MHEIDLGDPTSLGAANIKVAKPSVTTDPSVLRTLEVGYFSLNDQRAVRPLSVESLKYYCPPFSQHDPKFPWSLNEGYEKFRARDENGPDEHLDDLLATMIEMEKRRGEKLEVEFVSYRGMFTKFMASPYEPEESWQVNATRFQNTIFIEQDHASKIRQGDARPPKKGAAQQQGPPITMFWGFKFEAIATLPKPWAESTREEIENRRNDTVDNYASFCSLITTKFGDISVLLAGEVDCVRDYKSQGDSENASYIELKTAPAADTPHKKHAFEKKLLKFWAQSYLLGVPTTIVGFRDRDANVVNLAEFETLEIPKLVLRQAEVKWHANVCISATHKLLELLKHVVTDESVWSIGVRGGRTTRPKIEIQPRDDKTHTDILSKEFIDWREELMSRQHDLQSDTAPDARLH